MPMFKLIGVVENFSLLKDEVLALASERLTDQNQISLQTSVEGVEDWYSGIGQADKLRYTFETDYKFIQPSLKSSSLEKVINKYEGYRARVMNLCPRSCYSIHSDYSYRIHIPIVTNLQSWMVWPAVQEMCRMEEGYAYWTNTKAGHTAFNGSLENRLHIVMCVSKLW
jgi:hypothetical protein